MDATGKSRSKGQMITLGCCCTTCLSISSFRREPPALLLRAGKSQPLSCSVTSHTRPETQLRSCHSTTTQKWKEIIRQKTSYSHFSVQEAWGGCTMHIHAHCTYLYAHSDLEAYVALCTRLSADLPARVACTDTEFVCRDPADGFCCFGDVTCILINCKALSLWWKMQSDAAQATPTLNNLL